MIKKNNQESFFNSQTIAVWPFSIFHFSSPFNTLTRVKYYWNLEGTVISLIVLQANVKIIV